MDHLSDIKGIGELEIGNCWQEVIVKAEREQYTAIDKAHDDSAIEYVAVGEYD